MKKKGLVILAVAVAIAVIIVVIVVSSVKNSDRNSNNNTPSADTTEESFDVFPTQSPEEVMAYYESYGDVVSKMPVNESERAMTEAEAMALLLERGFDQYPVECPFNVDGPGRWDAVAAADSDIKHPTYETKYQTEDQTLWHIYLNGDCLFAASTVINARAGTSVIYSEQEHVLSYDTYTESFYEVDPHNSGQELRVVEYINAGLLEAITAEKESAE